MATGWSRVRQIKRLRFTTRERVGPSAPDREDRHGLPIRKVTVQAPVAGDFSASGEALPPRRSFAAVDPVVPLSGMSPTLKVPGCAAVTPRPIAKPADALQYCSASATAPSRKAPFPRWARERLVCEAALGSPHGCRGPGDHELRAIGPSFVSSGHWPGVQAGNGSRSLLPRRKLPAVAPRQDRHLQDWRPPVLRGSESARSA